MENDLFLQNILFSYEAQFINTDHINRYNINMHYWSHENPKWMRTIISQYCWSLNVWCEIIGDSRYTRQDYGARGGREVRGGEGTRRRGGREGEDVYRYDDIAMLYIGDPHPTPHTPSQALLPPLLPLPLPWTPRPSQNTSRYYNADKMF